MLLLAGCTAAPRAEVYVGIEPMADPALQQLLLVNLAAVPRLRVVDLSVSRNAWAFDFLQATTKIRLAARLGPSPYCMNALYTQWNRGVFVYRSSLSVPLIETDAQPDTCFARFAAALRDRLLPTPPSAAQQAKNVPDER